MLKINYVRNRAYLGESDSPPKTYESIFFHVIFYSSEKSIRDIRHFAVHCFVTAMLWSMLRQLAF